MKEGLEQQFAPELPNHVGAYETLLNPDIAPHTGDVFIYPSADYEDYLKMHKVIVGHEGADKLLDVYEALEQHDTPRTLSVAGWAAVEAALIRTDLSKDERLDLLVKGSDCWRRAIDRQRSFNAGEADCLIEDSYPYRMALDLACLPLFEGVINGTVLPETRREVFRDCLKIAEHSDMLLQLARQEGNTDAIADFAGLGYEVNGLLAFNMRCASGWFITPSWARSDTGYYHEQQTHDLLVFHHRNGRILNLTPVEIKSKTSQRDKARYESLLVRGKMHLSVPGLYTSNYTLAAIQAVYEKRGSKLDHQIVKAVSDRFVTMVRDYCAGDPVGHIVTRSVTRFRDKQQVVDNHPGLQQRAS